MIFAETMMMGYVNGLVYSRFFYIVLGWCEMIKYDADSRGGPDHIGNG